MCGRYTLTHPHQAFTAGQLGLFDPALFEAVRPRFNVAPTDVMPIVRRRSPDESALQLDLFRWGLIPFFSKDPREGAKMINARSEGIQSKPAFRRAFERKRCLVPADGFFEWEKIGKSKQPWYIRLKDGEPFAFAGLWDRWHPEGAPEGSEPIGSFTIITTRANPLVTPLHDRMPVILAPKDYDLWLDPRSDKDPLLALLVPFPGEAMSAYRVSPRVNRVENDDPDCIAPGQKAQGQLL
jgi:putative SOS response-associated peptidase YedK